MCVIYVDNEWIILFDKLELEGVTCPSSPFTKCSACRISIWQRGLDAGRKWLTREREREEARASKCPMHASNEGREATSETCATTMAAKIRYEMANPEVVVDR